MIEMRIPKLWLEPHLPHSSGCDRNQLARLCLTNNAAGPTIETPPITISRSFECFKARRSDLFWR